jgi:predicted nucleic acid-binding protein
VAIVIDASVALKWVVDEDGSQAARNLVMSETLVAPDLLFAECANALWVMARRKLISRSNATVAFAAIEAAPVRVVPLRAHAVAAQAIAFDLDQPVYDCLYLAVALAERAILVTADAGFVRAASANATFRSAVKSLA